MALRFLAAWYTYCLIDDLVMSEWFLYEDIWLNHMIFVTMISCLAIALKYTVVLVISELRLSTDRNRAEYASWWGFIVM